MKTTTTIIIICKITHHHARGVQKEQGACIGAMGGAPRHVPPLEEFWGGAAPPKIFKIRQNSSKDEKERKKSIKSGLKTRLERFKNQKFSYPTGLGAYTRPFGPRWCPPPGKFPVAPLAMTYIYIL